MSDEEICEMMGWPRRAAELLADYPDGLLGRICAVVREAERREREACARVCELSDEYGEGPDCWGWHAKDFARAIRARNNK